MYLRSNAKRDRETQTNSSTNISVSMPDIVDNEVIDGEEEGRQLVPGEESNNLTDGQGDGSGQNIAEDDARRPVDNNVNKDVIDEGLDSEIEFRLPGESNDEGDFRIREIAQAFNESQATERYLKKVGTCNGSKPEHTLRWLRAIDQLPEHARLATARAAAEDAVAIAIDNTIIRKWATLRRELARQFVSADFEQVQRDALRDLRQRPGESIHEYIFQFNLLLNEAFQTLPRDETPLVRDLLSGLCEMNTARAVAAKRPQRLQDAIRMVKTRVQTDDFLRPRPAKTHAISEKLVETGLQELKGLVSENAKAVSSLTAQVSALSALPKSNPKNINCFRCGQQGHFARECTTGTSLNQAGWQRDMVKCHRCRQEGHMVRDCKAPPPKKPCYKCGQFHWVYECSIQGRPVSTNGNNTNEGN